MGTLPMWMVLASARAAGAPEPVPAAEPEPAAEPAPAPAASVAEEVTVWGRAVEAARQAVVAKIEGLGYDRVQDRGDHVVYKQDVGWKGKVLLWDDGRIETRRRGVSGRRMPPIAGTRIRPYPLCLIQPTACVDLGSWYVDPHKWRAVEDTVARATAVEVVALGDRLADASLADTVSALPDRLDALWTSGAPLEAGAAPIATFQGRRAALLAFWDSRTETVWGQQVRDVVASFVRGEVQASEHPFTADEALRFDAVRRSAAPFPW